MQKDPLIIQYHGYQIVHILTYIENGKKYFVFKPYDKWNTVLPKAITFTKEQLDKLMDEELEKIGLKATE